MKIIKTLLVSTFLFTATFSYATTLKIASLAPDGSGWVNLMKQASENIAQKTNNRVKFKFYTGGIMGSDASVLRKMRVGQLNGGALAMGSLKQFSNIVNLYGIGFTFRNVDEVIQIRKKYDGITKAKLKQKGYEVLGIASGGFAYIMSENPINNLADIREQKFWLPDDDYMSQKVFKTANVNPKLLPVSDVYTGLQTGLINTIAVNPTSAILLQWYSKVNYLVDFPLTMLTGVFVVDNKTMKKLPAKDRDIVRREFALAFEKMDKQNIQEEANALKALKAGGIKFIKLDKKVEQEFRDFAKTSLKELDGLYPKKEYSAMVKDLEAMRAKK